MKVREMEDTSHWRARLQGVRTLVGESTVITLKTLFYEWAYYRIKILLCKKFVGKEGMGVFLRKYGIQCKLYM